MTTNVLSPTEIHARYGVNYDLSIDAQLQSVMDLLQPKLQQHQDKVAFRMGNATITFAQLDQASRRFAAFLQAYGVNKGERVAIQLPNILQYPVVMLGCLRAGVVLVNVNPLYTHFELAHQLTDANVTGLVVLTGMDSAYEKLDDTVKAQLDWVMYCSLSGDSPSSNDIMALMHLGDDSGKVSAKVTDKATNPATPTQRDPAAAEQAMPVPLSFAEMMNGYAPEDFSEVAIIREDLALLQYTGGTTGKPKGAMLTHFNIAANVLQCYEMFGDEVEAKTEAQIKILNPLPLYHIFSFSVCGLLGIYGGWQDILIPNPRDMDGLIATIESHRPNVIPSVNTLFNGMLHHPKFASLDFSELYLSIGGGTAIIKAIAEQWQAVTGQTINEGYGMSETAPVISFNPPSITSFNGSVGLPLPLTQVQVINDAGQRCAIGERGEVCIKGPQVMTGYWERDNQHTFTEEGYFKSGDIGFVDAEGFITLVDRKKDLILVSGFNVYPNEVEAALTEHPKVNEVAVVGVKDAHSGEVPKAYVVKADASLTEAELRNFASERLTGYKRPQYYEFIAELPKSAVGKILRKALR